MKDFKVLEEEVNARANLKLEGRLWSEQHFGCIKQARQQMTSFANKETNSDLVYVHVEDIYPHQTLESHLINQITEADEQRLLLPFGLRCQFHLKGAHWMKPVTVDILIERSDDTKGLAFKYQLAYENKNGERTYSEKAPLLMFYMASAAFEKAYDLMAEKLN